MFEKQNILFYFILKKKYKLGRVPDPESLGMQGNPHLIPKFPTGLGKPALIGYPKPKTFKKKKICAWARVGLDSPAHAHAEPS